MSCAHHQRKRKTELICQQVVVLIDIGSRYCKSGMPSHINIFTNWRYFFQTSGPSLSIALYGHSMAKLGKGQAIFGGRHIAYQSKIYSMTCSNRNCIISILDRELSAPKGHFLAIPIPDTISGCITGGNVFFLKKCQKLNFLQQNICFIPQM